MTFQNVFLDFFRRANHLSFIKTLRPIYASAKDLVRDGTSTVPIDVNRGVREGVVE